MAKIIAFNGLRPSKDLVEQIAELPYDVCNSIEAREIAGNNSYNFYHIIKPEIDLPIDIDVSDDQVYKKGAENLKKFIDNKYLVKDESPCLYLYTLIMNNRIQTGLVTCVNIDDYLNNIVKKHEFTREEKEKDRIRHLDELNAQTGLVFLLYKDDNKLKDLMNKALDLEPEYDFVANDGVRHIFRIINDQELITAFKDNFTDKELYIADGHHRAASAVKNGLARREKDSSHSSGEEAYNYFMSVLFPDSQLSIMAYNRAVKNLNNLNNSSFLDKLKEQFDVNETNIEIPEHEKSFCMYLDGKWYMLKLKFKISNNPVKSLDVSILQDFVLKPILGIDDPRTSKQIDFIGGIRGTTELKKIVDSKQYKVAFSLYPTSIDALIAVSDNNDVMPPKSTWFEPKLRSGIVSYLLD